MNEFTHHQPLSGLIDLHSHTNESDGSVAPEDLISTAIGSGLSALAITDHDTFDGYEKALPSARDAHFDLVRGIELNSRLEVDGERTRYVHLLGYFPFGEPSPAFSNWLSGQREDRRDRNQRLAESLSAKGIDIRIEEVEALGKSLAGRPHFARVLVQKGYAADADDAFQRYIGEEAPTYVERQSQSTEEVIQLIRAGGGIPVIAHPIRVSLPHGDLERNIFVYLRDAGLLGLEIYHPEHSPDLQAYYRDLAREIGLVPTGGSDFHGKAKPDIALGTGRRYNVQVPREFLDRMRALTLPTV